MEIAPPPAVEEVPGPTRNAAPTPPERTRDPNPKTGHYLGHGLFDNSGPNDFGA
jgi:hypothetical protein